MNSFPESPNSEDVKKVLKKAYNIYREIDEIKEEEEDKLINAVDKIPLNRLIDTEPDISVSLFFLFNCFGCNICNEALISPIFF